MQTIATPFLSHSGRETVSPAKESRPKGDCDVPPLESPFVSATVRRTAPYSSAAPCSVAAAASGALSFQNRTRCAWLRFRDRYTGPLAGSTPGIRWTKDEEHIRIANRPHIAQSAKLSMRAGIASSGAHFGDTMPRAAQPLKIRAAVNSQSPCGRPPEPFLGEDTRGSAVLSAERTASPLSLTHQFRFIAPFLPRLYKMNR